MSSTPSLGPGDALDRDLLRAVLSGDPAALATIVTGFGAVRLAAGGVLALWPGVLSRLLGADRRTADRLGYLVRMVAGREVALGVSALSAARSERPVDSLTEQLVSDAGDGLAVGLALARGRVRTVPAAAIVAFAAGSVGVEAWLITRQRR